ncbi:MAG: hypothetical protein LAN71_17760 [Acidobacteriia bacterium]|nr:hypothetical protein [Terriglobia bacterium]
MNVAGNGQYARGFIGWQRANGSLANPTPLVANDSLASFTIYGHNNNGTTYNQGAFIEAFATENWSLTNAGCLLIFGSTATGTTNVVPSLSLLGPKIGIGGVTAPTNMVSLDGQAARTIWMERNYTSNTAGNTLTVQGGGATSGATNKAGGDLILAAGLSTGTGESGVKIQSSPAGGSGTGDNALATQFQVLGNKIGFFTVTPVVRQTQGATLTNNVTAGGSANTLANYTSLTIYSTDAAAIRNDIYQLGQTLKTVVDALRLYGLLT